MHRQSTNIVSDSLELYMRTYYSLLRSSGDVWLRAFEEAHVYSEPSLHVAARDRKPDVAAFAYSAARLPECMPRIRRVVMGQSREQFEASGYPVKLWQKVKTRGRRRALRWNGEHLLAAFITSASDIDDMIPIMVAYQIEWNKLHELLNANQEVCRLLSTASTERRELDTSLLSKTLSLEAHEIKTLRDALGAQWQVALSYIASYQFDCAVNLLNGSFSEYQRASQRWWGDVEEAYLQEAAPRRRPVYFVSSNTHSLVNLLGGYARAHRDQITDFARRENPENLWPQMEAAQQRGDQHEYNNLTYYLLRAFLHQQHPDEQSRKQIVQAFDAQSGIQSLEAPGKIQVGAQVLEISKLLPERFDDRIRIPGLEKLRDSNALIINIDYPLGLASYHLLSRLAQGTGELRGLYVMGKAGTLNGRIGDVMIASVVHDEHSKNTYLFRNCFKTQDIAPWLKEGTVLDGQKALTVRGAFLQNHEYLNGFYGSGFTVLEMEAGPYLSAICELVNPQRHPNDEIVHLSNLTNFDVGILHYASDTPYSKRQSLLSKSLSYFGVDSTYSCSIAILRRIFLKELRQLGQND